MGFIRGDFLISDEYDLLDMDIIFNFLTNSYWAKDRSREDVIKSCQNSHCFGLYKTEKLIGFARVVTDKTVFAYLMDVFVLPEFRGQGLGKWMMETIFNHSDLIGVKSWMLATKDAHNLYKKFNFEPLEKTGKYMVRIK